MAKLLFPLAFAVCGFTLISASAKTTPAQPPEKVGEKPPTNSTSKPEDKGGIKLPCEWQAGDAAEYRATFKNSQGQGTSLVRMPVVKIPFTVRVLSRDAEAVIVECSATPPPVAELPEAFIKQFLALAATMYDVKPKIKIKLSDGAVSVTNGDEGEKAVKANLDALLKRTDSLKGLNNDASDKQREAIEKIALSDMDGTLMQLYREVTCVPGTRAPQGETRSELDHAIAIGRVMKAKVVRSLDRTKDGGFSVSLRTTVPNSAELGQQLLGMVRDLGVKLSEDQQRSIRDSTTSLVKFETTFDADAKGWLIRGSSRSVIRGGIPAIAYDREVEIVRLGLTPAK